MKLFYSIFLTFYFFIFPFSLNAIDECSVSFTTIAVDINETNGTYTSSITDTSNSSGKYFYVKVGGGGSASISVVPDDGSDMKFEYTTTATCPADTGNGINFVDVVLVSPDDDFNIIVYSGNAAQKTYGLTITWVSPVAPAVRIPDQSAIVNETYILDTSNYVTDPNNSPIISYTMIGLPSGLNYYDTNGTIYGTPNVLGSYDINVTATDDTNLTSPVDIFTLEVQELTDVFCYGYSYQQQGLNFTERDNNGTEIPLLKGDVAINEPISMSIYIKNKSYFNVADLNISVNDINNTQVTYIEDTATLVNVGSLVAVDIPDNGSQIGTIEISTIGYSDYAYVYYNVDPQISYLNTPIDIDLNFSLNNTSRVQTLGNEVEMCSVAGSNGDYSITYRIFNIEHEKYFVEPLSVGEYPTYNLPTQIVKRADNFKIVSYDSDNPNTRKDINGTVVHVELIKLPTGDADADCNNPLNSISERIKVPIIGTNTPFNATVMTTNSLNNKATADTDFYRTAIEDTAFRISYEVYGDDDSILDINPVGDEYNIANFTELASGVALANTTLGLPSNELNKCRQPVVVGNHTYTTMPEACGNASDTNTIDFNQLSICLECVYGFNTRYSCSRDNFAIRPEAFMVKIDDQNQTNKTSQTRLADNISGVETPTLSDVNMAAGYDYELEVTATNSLDSTVSFGYTKSPEANYIWEPRTGTPTGCDESNSSTSLIFSNGYAVNAESNVSQVGEYRLNLTDTTWTSVDQNASHHVSPYFNTNTDSDCVQNSSAVENIGLSSATNGCNISSSHLNSDANIAYNDYNITFHPYDFNVSTITPTVGLTNSAVDSNSFIYMTNMSFNNGQDQNMSYHLNGNIIAQGYNGTQLTNFVDNCYAKDTNISIIKSNTDLNDTYGNPVVYQYRFNDINSTGGILYAQDGNLTDPAAAVNVQLSDGNFTTNLQGSMITRLNLNYNREINTTVNPKAISFTSYNVDCTNAVADCTFNADLIPNKTTTGTKDLNSSLAIPHYYGRTHAGKQRFVVPDDSPYTANIYYEIYCFNTSSGTTCDTSLLPSLNRTNDIRWFQNTNNVSSRDGNVGTVCQKGSVACASGENNIVDATDPVENTPPPTTTNLSYDASRDYPYRTTMENTASRWLIYNKDDFNATRNQFQVEFNKAGGWSGEHETDTTTKSGTVKTNRRTMW